jgi:protein-tyrosine phosphatase
MLRYIKRTIDAGYQPILAHVERYACVQEDPLSLRQCREAGGLVQVNAGSILGEEGGKCKRLCKSLLAAELVDLVGSDAHDVLERKPNLAQCAKYIEKKMGVSYAVKLLELHPEQVI